MWKQSSILNQRGYVLWAPIKVAWVPPSCVLDAAFVPGFSALHKSPMSSSVLCKGVKVNHANDHLLCSAFFFLPASLSSAAPAWSLSNVVLPTVRWRTRSRRERYGTRRLLTLIHALTPYGASVLDASFTRVYLPCQIESGWTEMTAVWIRPVWRLIYCRSDLMVAEEDRRWRREHTYASTANFSPH